MSTHSRRLGELARAAGTVMVEIVGADDAEVTGVAYDSREVTTGDLFFCIPGTSTDGHGFAPAAVAAGAAVLCVERQLDVDVPQIVVTDARKAMARLTAEFYGRPSEDLMILGVTGTNGKTTTTFLLESILRSGGHRTGLIGTIETRVADTVQPGIRTTPESLDLQKLFARTRDAGVHSVAMEVTSHALSMQRVEGVRFASVGFTNLSQDHLDFHDSMDDYFAAKRSLFRPEMAAKAAVNVDDPYGKVLFEERALETIGFGVSPDAQVHAREIKLEPSGTHLSIETPLGNFEAATSLVGHFNVSNCLAAAAVALQAGVGLDAIRAGLEALAAVPGRFETVDAGQPFSVVVDYAHTPDSLDNVLQAARPLAEGQGGRVVCVFGCGGDRDRGKRPLMGAVVARLADLAIVTSDNPRSEEPETIIEEILVGVRNVLPEGPAATLPDRREAISRALELAKAGDVIVIAGKGHETGQEFATETIPFDDRLVAKELLVDLGYRGGRS